MKKSRGREGVSHEGLGTHDITEWLGWEPRFESLIREATTPVYLRQTTGRLHALGSAVFLALGERRFLVTAAHVADEMLAGSSEIGFGTDLAPSRPRFVTTVLPRSGRRRDDVLDIAVAEVEPQELVDKRITAVPPRVFDIEGGSYGDDLFLAAGYPHTRQKPRVKDNSIDAYLYRTAALAKDVPATDDLRQFLLDLDFNRRRLFVEGRQFTGPSLEGMSGGGIWRVDEDDRSFRLAAVLTEYDQGKRRIRATRLWFVLAAIWNEFPELRHHIPEETIE